MQSFSTAPFIQSPKSLGTEHIGQLRRLIERYPYYQTARLMLLQALYNSNDPLFNNEIRRQAPLISDLGTLFRMVRGNHYTLPSLHANPTPAPPSGDRMTDLINQFLDSRPPQPATSETADIKTDYMSYLESLEAQGGNDVAANGDGTDNHAHGHNARRPTPQPKRNLLDRDDYATPEVVEVPRERYFTETLAKIYIKQKKYARALEIIQSLSAANPKKSSYFADQIRFLEKLIEIDRKSRQ